MLVLAFDGPSKPSRTQRTISCSFGRSIKYLQQEAGICCGERETPWKMPKQWCLSISTQPTAAKWLRSSFTKYEYKEIHPKTVERKGNYLAPQSLDVPCNSVQLALYCAFVLEQGQCNICRKRSLQSSKHPSGSEAVGAGQCRCPLNFKSMLSDCMHWVSASRSCHPKQENVKMITGNTLFWL